MGTIRAIIDDLRARFWPTGVFFLGGLLLIAYSALGFLYWQQGAQQKEYEAQIANLSVVLARLLPSGQELQVKYDEANQALAPVTDSEAIAMLVSIAEESGIDIDEKAGKFRVPSAKSSRAKVGGGTYQLLSFDNIRVQGDDDSVMAFITNLDSGKTLGTMVLKRVATSEVKIMFTGEEVARRAEFRLVASAVTKMMEDNNLLVIPDPMNFAGGMATNFMGDGAGTEEEVEGFPDITTTAAGKGYTGTGSPRDGYVLYRHDKISTDDTTQFETISYISTLTTKYYYTCEADGTVRQFDGANVATATEYRGSEASRMETVVTLSVVIYTKLEA